jgi:hypothetical protein
VPIPTVVTALRDHLIALGIGRAPETPGSLPPIWRDPKTGTPAPGEGDNPTMVGPDAVIGLYRVSGIPPRRFEGERRTPVVLVLLRVSRAPIGDALIEQIEQAVLDRRDWLMGSVANGQLRVIESQQVGPFNQTASDAQSYDYRSTFAFELYRSPVVAVP